MTGVSIAGADVRGRWGVRAWHWLCVLIGAAIGLAVGIWIRESWSLPRAEAVHRDYGLTRGQSLASQDLPTGEYTEEERIGIAVYDKASRSVVNIRTTGEVRGMFAFQAVPVEGSGSGWILDNQGTIVTNFHVVEGSETIEVTLFDGQTMPATLIGADPPNDIAVLRAAFPAEALFPVELGESTNLRVGQKIFAIGSPFGLERTMTEGIVSSLNRTLRAKTQDGRLIKSVIQIDAALNQGNSGGPLLDSRGRVVGMNTAIATSTGDNAGIGFAIPISAIRRVLPQLIENGRVIRPTLGIAKTFETSDGYLGIHVLIENGPAERAGLQGAYWVEKMRVAGGSIIRQYTDPRHADFILAINDQPVRTFDQLLGELEKYKPGDTVQLTILRGGKKSNVPVQLEAE